MKRMPWLLRSTKCSSCPASPRTNNAKLSAEPLAGGGEPAANCSSYGSSHNIGAPALGARLVRAFQAKAGEHGCSNFYLETFNFQAPSFYASLGYTVAHEHKVYPHGISKLLMVKHSGQAGGAA